MNPPQVSIVYRTSSTVEPANILCVLVGDKPPAFLLNLLKHHSKSDQPTPELVRAREGDSEGNRSSDGSRTVARKHSPLRLWTYNFWSP